MKKLKTRAISYDRLLFILSTINPNISIPISIIVDYKMSKIVASIGTSNYIIKPDIWHIGIVNQIKTNLSHVPKYTIHNL